MYIRSIYQKVGRQRAASAAPRATILKDGCARKHGRAVPERRLWDLFRVLGETSESGGRKQTGTSWRRRELSWSAPHGPLVVQASAAK